MGNGMEPALSGWSPAAIEGFRDGLGERFIVDGASPGEHIEILQLRSELTSVSSFEFALRERTARLASFQHESYARVRQIEATDARLAVVSDHVEGWRLADVLAAVSSKHLELDIASALSLLTQLVHSVAILHEQARGIAHGAIAPERIIITPKARLVVAEYVLGSALERLEMTRERLWRQLRVAVPPAAGGLRFDHRADVTQIGTVALALVLGRPLTDDEFPHHVADLLATATENRSPGGRQPIAKPLRAWLARALQLDFRNSFQSAVEAQSGLEAIISQEPAYATSPMALQGLLTLYKQSLPPVESVQPPVVAPVPSEPVVARRTIPMSVADDPELSRLFAETGSPDSALADIFAAAEAEMTPEAEVTPEEEITRGVISGHRHDETTPGVGSRPNIAQLIEQELAHDVRAAKPAQRERVPRVDARERAARVEASEQIIARRIEETAPASTAPAAPAPAPAPAVEAPTPVAAEKKDDHPPVPNDRAARAEGSERHGVPRVEGDVFDQGYPGALESLLAATAESEPEVEEAPAKRRRSIHIPGRVIVRVLGGIAALLVVCVGGYTAFSKLSAAPPPATGTLVVESQPAGLAVLIDGTPRGVTPVKATLPAGPHKLQLKTNEDERVIPINITAGGQVSQYIEASTTPMTGRLQITSEPSGAMVIVDGVRKGAAPVLVADLSAGKHRVELQSEAGNMQQEVSIEAGGTSSLVVPMPKQNGPVSGWVSIGVPVELQVFEGGKLLGTSQSDRILVTAGRHDLELVNETLGFRSKQSVQVTAGKVATVNVQLPKGALNVNAVPWAEVWVDGDRVGETPIGNLALPIGPHEVVFRNPQFAEQRHAVTVTTRAAARVSVDLRK